MNPVIRPLRSAASRFRPAWAGLMIGIALGTWPLIALAADTPSLQNGDCWQVGTPTTCRVTWAGKNTFIYFRAIDQFSSQRPGWKTQAQAAVNAWNSAPGPQYYSFSAQPNDTWIYLVYSSTGQNGLLSGNDAITWNCDRSGYCVDTLTAMNIYWTDVYLNHNVLDTQGPSIVQNAFAHESGHGMGLDHNTTDANSVMWPSQTGIGGPDASDWGRYPGCSSGGHGLDCIYGYGD